MLVLPFRVFGETARTSTLPPGLVLLWNRLLVQSVSPLKYCRYWFGNPALPLTLRLGCAVFLQRGLPATVKSPSKSSLRASPSFRVSPSFTYPIRRSESSPLMGFDSLQHIQHHRSTCRGFADPLRSAFRVWLPSWRLTPCDALPVLFRTGSARGIHPSEVSPPGRFPEHYHPDGPAYRFAYRCSRRRSDGPAQ